MDPLFVLFKDYLKLTETDLDDEFKTIKNIAVQNGYSLSIANEIFKKGERKTKLKIYLEQKIQILSISL